MSDHDGSVRAQQSTSDCCAFAHLVRWAFERLYREFAWTYDMVAAAVSGGLWRRWGQTALPYVRGRVLELGSGPGHLQLALAAAGQPAAGVDASPQMISLARRRLARAHYPAHLSQARAQHLPFASASFDTILATFPSEYIVDPLTQSEMRRVLAPGGRVVIVPTAQQDPGLSAWLVDLAYRLIGQGPARSDAAFPPTLQLGNLLFTTNWLRVGPSRVLLLINEA